MILDDESGWIIGIINDKNVLEFVYDFTSEGRPEIDISYLVSETFEENKIDNVVDKLIKKGYNAKKLWLDIKLKEKKDD